MARISLSAGNLMTLYHHQVIVTWHCRSYTEFEPKTSNVVDQRLHQAQEGQLLSEPRQELVRHFSEFDRFILVDASSDLMNDKTNADLTSRSKLSLLFHRCLPRHPVRIIQIYEIQPYFKTFGLFFSWSRLSLVGQAGATARLKRANSYSKTIFTHKLSHGLQKLESMLLSDGE